MLPPGSVRIPELTYVVIGAREDGRWVYVRHAERETWEFPAGHIEPGEHPDHAAERELYEETGATEANLEHLHDYEVRINGKADYGRLYFGKIIARGPLPDSEIGEIVVDTATPGPATYPEAHAKFTEVLGTLVDQRSS